MSDTAVIQTDNITKKFGNLVAVNSISWGVDTGQTKAIIGPNGAGKSTFFNLVSGVLSPTSGSISFDGEPIASKPEHEIARRGLIKTFQQTNIYEESTVFENIRIGAQMKETAFNMWSRADSLTIVNERTEEVLTRFGLDDYQDRIASDLPHGLQRKVEVGIALATDPDVILFDEPIAGMSEEGRNEMLDVLTELSEDPSLTIVITEHDFDFIMNLADEVTVLHQGSVLTEGTPNEITDNEQVQNVYLGGE